MVCARYLHMTRLREFIFEFDVCCRCPLQLLNLTTVFFPLIRFSSTQMWLCCWTMKPSMIFAGGHWILIGLHTPIWIVWFPKSYLPWLLLYGSMEPLMWILQSSRLTSCHILASISCCHHMHPWSQPRKHTTSNYQSLRSQMQCLSPRAWWQNVTPVTGSTWRAAWCTVEMLSPRMSTQLLLPSKLSGLFSSWTGKRNRPKWKELILFL